MKQKEASGQGGSIMFTGAGVRRGRVYARETRQSCVPIVCRHSIDGFSPATRRTFELGNTRASSNPWNPYMWCPRVTRVEAHLPGRQRSARAAKKVCRKRGRKETNTIKHVGRCKRSLNRYCALIGRCNWIPRFPSTFTFRAIRWNTRSIVAGGGVEEIPEMRDAGPMLGEISRIVAEENATIVC